MERRGSFQRGRGGPPRGSPRGRGGFSSDQPRGSFRGRGGAPGRGGFVKRDGDSPRGGFRGRGVERGRGSFPRGTGRGGPPSRGASRIGSGPPYKRPMGPPNPIMNKRGRYDSPGDYPESNGYSAPYPSYDNHPPPSNYPPQSGYSTYSPESQQPVYASHAGYGSGDYADDAYGGGGYSTSGYAQPAQSYYGSQQYGSEYPPQSDLRYQSQQPPNYPEPKARSYESGSYGSGANYAYSPGSYGGGGGPYDRGYQSGGGGYGSAGYGQSRDYNQPRPRY